jgi:HAD superfamily hydrolase (TIGR01509 family)
MIFDLDGTLVDSELCCNQALIDLIPEIEDTATNLVSRYRGKKLANILADIGIRIGRGLPEDFEVTYRRRVSVLFDEQLQAMPWADEALSLISAPVCVASSGPMSKIRHALRLTGLDRHFGDRVFSSYDVGAWKPDPGLFLHAAREMGFSADQCIVVEDSPVGIAAAIAAGMRAIQFIPDREQPVAPGATAISDLRELSRISF